MASKIDLTILPKENFISAPPPKDTTTRSRAAKPRTGGLGFKGLFNIACIVVPLCILVSFMNHKNSPTYQTPMPASQNRPPASYVEQSKPVAAAPARPASQKPALARPSFSKPTVGVDQVLSEDQIAYCLAESIRIEAGKQRLDNYVERDVERFNLMVGDYNGRCGQYRYRSGDLESAKALVEPLRASLEAEGRNRFYKAPPPSAAKSVPAPRRDMAEELVNSVCNNGQWGDDKAAIAQCVATQHQASPPDWSKRPAGQQKTAERACRADRAANGEASYNTCLWRQLQYFRK